MWRQEVALKSKLGKLEIVWKKSEKVLVLQVYGSFEGFSLSALFRLVSYRMTLLQWTGLLLFLVYYVFATIGVQLFGGQIYDGHPALKGSGFAEGDLVAGKQHLDGLGGMPKPVTVGKSFIHFYEANPIDIGLH